MSQFHHPSQWLWRCRLKMKLLLFFAGVYLPTIYLTYLRYLHYHQGWIMPKAKTPREKSAKGRAQAIFELKKTLSFQTCVSTQLWVALLVWLNLWTLTELNYLIGLKSKPRSTRDPIISKFSPSYLRFTWLYLNTSRTHLCLTISE